jgi:hypothetical protein
MKTREELLEQALVDVMAWIDNWSPDFVYDAEWPETLELINAALDDRPVYIGLART